MSTKHDYLNLPSLEVQRTEAILRGMGNSHSPHWRWRVLKRSSAKVGMGNSHSFMALSSSGAAKFQKSGLRGQCLSVPHQAHGLVSPELAPANCSTCAGC